MYKAGGGGKISGWGCCDNLAEQRSDQSPSFDPKVFYFLCVVSWTSWLFEFDDHVIPAFDKIFVNI